MTQYTRPPQHRVVDNLDDLLTALPPDIRLRLEEHDDLEDLLEIVMDLGRIPEARFPSGPEDVVDRPIDRNDIDYVVDRIGEFGKDNRAGIPATLHRISAIRNRHGKVVGLTCRIGRAVEGTIDIMRDAVESGKSILMLGRPGVGKTTKCREVGRVLADDFNKRVVIVDTSNEIAGDGDVPHPGIGRARRMQVPDPEHQHAVMIEAVENHMPEVIIIDEIGTEQEAFASRTIAERGVQLVATAHGNSLENLLMNPTLSDLVGGIQAVTLSDEEARRRGTQKTVLERRAPPTFDIVIEILEKDKMAVHLDVAQTVDRMLRGQPPRPEIRARADGGRIEILQHGDVQLEPPPNGHVAPTQPFGGDNGLRRHASERGEPPRTFSREEPSGPDGPKLIRLYPYGVSRSRLERAIKELKVPVQIARTWADADAIIALKAHARREPARLTEAISQNKPTFIVKSNTQVQVESVIREMFGGHTRGDEDVVRGEVEDAVEQVRATGQAVDLAPANSYLRRVQHQMAEEAGLASASVGDEPRRYVRISPVL